MRPNGWERTILLEIDNIKKGAPIAQYDIPIYEAGADAMLEGLKKDSFPVGHLISSVFLTNLPYDATLIEYEGKKGHLVFIPEE